MSCSLWFYKGVPIKFTFTCKRLPFMAYVSFGTLEMQNLKMTSSVWYISVRELKESVHVIKCWLYSD